MLCAHAASEGGTPGAQRVISKNAVSLFSTPPAIFADHTSRNAGAAGFEASNTTYAHVAGSGRSASSSSFCVSGASGASIVASPSESEAHVACVARSAFATWHAAASASACAAYVSDCETADSTPGQKHPASFQAPSAAQHASSAPEAHAPSVPSAAVLDAQSRPAAEQRAASARSAASAKRRVRENRGGGIPVAPKRREPRARARASTRVSARTSAWSVSRRAGRIIASNSGRDACRACRASESGDPPACHTRDVTSLSLGRFASGRGDSDSRRRAR